MRKDGPSAQGNGLSEMSLSAEREASKPTLHLAAVHPWAVSSYAECRLWYSLSEAVVRPGEMLNREENQKAVDGTSQAIPITVEGSCRKASIQGRVALGSGRQSEGEAWGHVGSWPVQLQLASLWRFSQASRERLSIRFWWDFSDFLLYLKYYLIF